MPTSPRSAASWTSSSSGRPRSRRWRLASLALLGAALGAGAVVAAELLLLPQACTATQLDSGLRTTRSLAPISAAVPGGGAAIAAAADAVIGSMQERLDQVLEQQRRDHDALVAAGQRPPPEENLSWQQWLYVALGVGGGALGSKQLAQRQAKSQLADFATGAAKAILAARENAAPSDVLAALNYHLPVGVDLDHDALSVRPFANSPS